MIRKADTRKTSYEAIAIVGAVASEWIVKSVRPDVFDMRFAQSFTQSFKDGKIDWK